MNSLLYQRELNHSFQFTLYLNSALFIFYLASCIYVVMVSEMLGEKESGPSRSHQMNLEAGTLSQTEELKFTPLGTYWHTNTHTLVHSDQRDQQRVGCGWLGPVELL